MYPPIYPKCASIQKTKIFKILMLKSYLYTGNLHLTRTKICMMYDHLAYRKISKDTARIQIMHTYILLKPFFNIP